MKKYYSILLLSCVCVVHTFSQVYFQKTVGFSDSTLPANANWISKTPDGGYITCGDANSNFSLAKLNSNGDTTFTKSFANMGPGSWAACIVPTNDGGYIVSGVSYYYDVEVMKLNAAGDTLWTKSIVGNVNNPGYSAGRSVIQTSDGNYVVSGRANKIINNTWEFIGYLAKLNANGDTLWTKLFSNPGPTYLEMRNVKETHDGGLIFVGGPQWGGNVCLVRTNSLGDTLWTKTYTGFSTGSDNFESGNFIEETSDYGFILCGYSNYNSVLVKTDAAGNVLWSKQYGNNTYLGAMHATDVKETPDHGYIFTGTVFIDSSSTYSNALLIKTDSIGDTLWTRSYGRPGRDLGTSVELTNDGGYILAGTTSETGFVGRMYFVKTDAGGNSYCNEQFFPCAVSNITITTSFFPCNVSSGLFISGTSPAVGALDYSGSFCYLIGLSEYNDPVLVNVFPNPSDGNFSVALPDAENSPIAIFDELGRKINFISEKNGNKIEVKNVPPGFYIMQIYSPQGTVVKKIVVNN